MKSLQTSMYLELIDNKTRDIISSQTLTAKKVHISENTAKANTLKQLGPKIAGYIIDQAVKLWSNRLVED